MFDWINTKYMIFVFGCAILGCQYYYWKRLSKDLEKIMNNIVNLINFVNQK